MRCLICGKEFKEITNTHLRSHNLTPRQYLEKFPNAEIRRKNRLTKKQLQEYSKRMKKMRKLKIIVPPPMSQANKIKASKRMEGEKNPNFKNGNIKKIEKLYADKLNQHTECELCGSKLNLLIHHLDGDHDNNKEENLKVLCHQCHDTIHQKGYNFHKKQWALKLSEIFYSLQGEGPSAGRPALFIRTFGCHTQCPWCDTDFSWKGKYFSVDYKKIAKILIENKKKHKMRRIVITGGESLEQRILPIIMIGKLLNCKIEVETNGKPLDKESKASETLKLPPFVDRFNVSPKLWSKEKIRTFRKSRIKKLTSVNSIFKFVVKNESDVEVVKEMIRRGIPKNRVWLMPFTTFNEERDKKTRQEVWNYCIKNNFNYSPRLQVEIWGNKREI